MDRKRNRNSRIGIGYCIGIEIGIQIRIGIGTDQANISRHLDILWQNHVLDRVIKLTENRNVFKYTYKLNV